MGYGYSAYASLYRVAKYTLCDIECMCHLAVLYG